MDENRKKELKKVALGIYKGHIFTDMHCDSPEEVFKLFMLMSLTEDDSIIKGIKSGKISMVYEYMDKSLRWAINGKPMFLSCKFLNKEEKSLVMNYIEKLEEAEENVLEGDLKRKILKKN